VKIPRPNLDSLVTLRDKPEKTALAFALGVLVGFSPFFGLHLILGLLVAFLFRLNKVAVMIGVLTNTPWLAVPFYTFSTWLGILMLGLPSGISAPQVGFLELLTPEFWGWLISQWRVLIPVFVGSTAVSVALSVLSYPVALFLLRKYYGRVSTLSGLAKSG